MKKACFIILAFVVSLGFSGIAESQCPTLKSGTIVYSATHYYGGEPIKPGYDEYGYNYQAHMFNGSFVNVYLGGDGYPPYTGDDATYLIENPTVTGHWAWPYRTTQVVMKWNDAWISNKDCNGDGKLDRHDGYASYIGSGAWETNHQSDSYTITDSETGKEKTCHWTYFTKIVAVPSDARNISGVWFTSESKEIGPDIWGEFATIEEIYNDPCSGYHGKAFLSPIGPGFGHITK